MLTRKRCVNILQESEDMLRDDRGSNCMGGLLISTKITVKLNYFRILALYCFDTPKKKTSAERVTGFVKEDNSFEVSA